MSVILEYECPCCGGKVEFDSSSQKMKCPYCDSEFDMEAMQGHDKALEQEQQATPEDEAWEMEQQQFLDEEKAGLKVYRCKSCGGEIVTDETTAATHCPYCGAPVIMVGNLSDDLKPDGVIPFKLDKKAAVAALKTHMTGKKLLDKRFASDSHLEEIKGVYIPFWLFDAEANGQARFRATRVRSWETPRERCTETSYYDVARSGKMSFQQIPVDGSEKAPDDLMESVEPFDYAAVVPFQTGYLSGYMADRYDVNSDKCRERAHARAKRSMERALAGTVTGYNTVTPELCNVHLENPSAKYVLCPVWLLTSSYEGKTYLFAVNGQTGKIAGNMPLNKKAEAGHMIGWTLGLGAVFSLLSLLMFEFDLMVIFASFFFGFLIALGIVGQMRKEVLNVEFKDDASGYTDPGGLLLTVQQDRFLYTRVSRTPIQQNSGGASRNMGTVSGSVRHQMNSPRPPAGGSRPPLGGTRPPVGGSRPPMRSNSGPRPGVSRPGGSRPGGSRPGGRGPGGPRRP